MAAAAALVAMTASLVVARKYFWITTTGKFASFHLEKSFILLYGRKIGTFLQFDSSAFLVQVKQ